MLTILVGDVTTEPAEAAASQSASPASWPSLDLFESWRSFLRRRRPARRLGLAAEVLQHLLLALVGAGPLAVATDVPDHIVGQVLIHPGGIAPLQGLEALPDDGDVGMLVMGHYRRKLDQAKTPEEARRSLKRHLANVVYSHLVTDHCHRTQGC